MNGLMAQPTPLSTARLSAAPPGRELRDELPHLPAISAVVAIAVGVVVLVGWWLAIDILKSIVPGVLTTGVSATGSTSWTSPQRRALTQ
jgi:hypothetical protein